MVFGNGCWTMSALIIFYLRCYSLTDGYRRWVKLCNNCWRQMFSGKCWFTEVRFIWLGCFEFLIKILHPPPVLYANIERFQWNAIKEKKILQLATMLTASIYAHSMQSTKEELPQKEQNKNNQMYRQSAWRTLATTIHWITYSSICFFRSS